MKVLILLTYFNRPVLVKNALASVGESALHHDDWEMVFGDDGSPHPGEPICRAMLPDHLDRIRFVNSHATLEQKLATGISIGAYANRLVRESDAEIVITLCDDDALHPEYLAGLNRFFKENPVQYAYSHVSIFNPMHERPGKLRMSHKFNLHTTPINPANLLDTSQVAFRADVIRRHGCGYPETTATTGKPWVGNLDAGLFQDIHDHFGPAPFTGMVGQYKGIHDHQLVWHKNSGRAGLEHYVRQSGALAGKTL